jgi:hypothetical protein
MVICKIGRKRCVFSTLKRRISIHAKEQGAYHEHSKRFHTD